MPTTSEARTALDKAIADVLPLSGGKIRKRLKQLRRALAEHDHAEQRCATRSCGHRRTWHRPDGCVGDLLHCRCAGFEEAQP